MTITPPEVDERAMYVRHLEYMRAMLKRLDSDPQVGGVSRFRYREKMVALIAEIEALLK